MIVAIWIEREVSQQLPVLGDHAHVEPVHEQDHPLALVGVPGPDVVKAGAVSKRHLAALIDAVSAYADTGPHADPRPGRARLVPRLERSDRWSTSA